MASSPASSAVSSLRGLPTTAASTACSRSGRAATRVDDDADALDRRSPVRLDRRRHVDEREVPHLPVAHLLEVELRAGPGRRNPDRGQQLAGPQHGHPRDVDARADEVVLGVDDPLAAARSG